MRGFIAFCTAMFAGSRGHSSARAALDRGRTHLQPAGMNFLLPQTREATVLQVRGVSLHGDRYLDLVLQVDEPGSAPLSVRLGAAECPADLVQGDKVQARIMMGVVVKLERS